MGDAINAVTVSRDLPFAHNRFCGAEDVKSMRVGMTTRTVTSVKPSVL